MENLPGFSGPPYRGAGHHRLMSRHLIGQHGSHLHGHSSNYLCDAKNAEAVVECLKAGFHEFGDARIGFPQFGSIAEQSPIFLLRVPLRDILRVNMKTPIVGCALLVACAAFAVLGSTARAATEFCPATLTGPYSKPNGVNIHYYRLRALTPKRMETRLLAGTPTVALVASRSTLRPLRRPTTLFKTARPKPTIPRPRGAPASVRSAVRPRGDDDTVRRG